jgi:hypothetical protein
MMKVFLLRLGLFIGILNTVNCSIASEYFGRVITLRAARAMVNHLIVVPNLKPLELATIKDVDDAWRIGHKLADIDNFYSHHINLKQHTFSEMETKRCLIGRVALNLYRMLPRADPSISLVELRTLLFNDHFFCNDVYELCSAELNKQEFPACEADRLGFLFIRLPREKCK